MLAREGNLRAYTQGLIGWAACSDGVMKAAEGLLHDLRAESVCGIILAGRGEQT